MTTIRWGRSFYKMTGSGNDFVFFDAREIPPGSLESTETITRLSKHGTGVGADGVVFLSNSHIADIRMRYYNADGSLASLCGNATLCATRLADELQMAQGRGGSEFNIETDAGIISARIVGGLPEIDLEPVEIVIPSHPSIQKLAGESRLGFALAGVPHVVVEVPDADVADVDGRGAEVRHHQSLPQGANVNFVSRDPNDTRWTLRTFERGVEGETLACGTGAVATSILLSEWGLTGPKTELLTRSGQVLTVTLKRDGNLWYPSLRGEGRIVFQGQLGEIEQSN